MFASPRKRVAVIVAAILLVTLAALWAWRVFTVQPPQLTLINGERLTFAALRGRPVLLVFWATTCAPCVREAPDLAALYRALPASGFELIAVAMHYDPPAQVLAFKETHQLPYRVALDMDGAVAKHFKVQAIPRALLLDANGEIVLDKLGVLEMNTVRRHIEKLLRAN